MLVGILSCDSVLGTVVVGREWEGEGEGKGGVDGGGGGVFVNSTD